MDKKMGAITLNPYFKAEVNMFITVKSDHVHIFFFSINVDFQFLGIKDWLCILFLCLEYDGCFGQQLFHC